jgi:hypothetical protein
VHIGSSVLSLLILCHALLHDLGSILYCLKE